MKKGIRVTALSTYYACAYKFKNAAYEVDIRNTYKWDILNAAATSQAPVDNIIDYYTKNISQDLKEAEVIKEVVPKVVEYIQECKDHYSFFAQERKFILPYNDEYYIEGTPDMYMCDDSWWGVVDLKFSTHSWFEHDESWSYNLQTYIYPLMVMEYYNVESCYFQYQVYDKNNGRWKKIWPKMRTREECREIVRYVMEKYIESEFTGEYNANKNRYCWFCPLKKDWSCPLWQKPSVETLL